MPNHAADCSLVLRSMDANATTTVLSVTRAQTIRFMTATSMTLLLYDWLLLFGDEVNFIWKSSSLFVKLFYFVIRYPTFTDISLTIIYYFTTDLPSSHCLADYRTSVYIAAIGTACTELVLIWRTYALWNKSTKVLISLLVMWTIWVFGNVYPVVKFNQSVVFVAQILPGIPGCFLVGGDPIIFICYATLLAVEIVIIIFTLTKGIKSFCSSRSALVMTLYRDGILFFLIVASSSSGNVITLLVAPTEYTDLLNSFARVIHTVLCSRVVIHLRIAARRGEEATVYAYPTRKSAFPSLRFRHSTHQDETIGGTTMETIEMTDLTNSAGPSTTTYVSTPEP